MNIETRLIEILRQEIKIASGDPCAALHRDTVLAETGLDSLGFATMMVAMEREFALDPFGGTDDIIYPETFGELLALYEKAQDRVGEAIHG